MHYYAYDRHHLVRSLLLMTTKAHVKFQFDPISSFGEDVKLANKQTDIGYHNIDTFSLYYCYQSFNLQDSISPNKRNIYFILFFFGPNMNTFHPSLGLPPQGRYEERPVGIPGSQTSPGGGLVERVGEPGTEVDVIEELNPDIGEPGPPAPEDFGEEPFGERGGWPYAPGPELARTSKFMPYFYIHIIM